jgi:peptidoglycan/LPS O-acetylase OafA/YrhL
MRPLAPRDLSRLDALRAVAVLVVVASHVFFEHRAVASTGRVGVLFFFVHTSLVLMFSLERQFARSGNARLFSGFMVRRAFRLFPLSVLVVLVLAALAIPGYVFPDGDVHALSVDTLGLVANLMLVQNEMVSAGGSTLLGPLWTLPIELQMYLSLPLLFLVLRRVSDHRLLVLGWGASAVLSLGLITIVYPTFGRVIATFSWGWLQMPRVFEFLPYFLAGVLAHALWNHRSPGVPFLVLPMALVAIVVGYWALVPHDPSGDMTALIGMVACLGLAMLLPVVREPKSRFIRESSAFVARYSYGIYLVHVPCIWLGFQVLGAVPVPIQWAGFVVSTIGISMLLYHFVEAPFIRFGTRLSYRWMGVAPTVTEEEHSRRLAERTP